MNERFNKFEEWLNAVENYQFPSWEQLPDIDLYSDQVLSFLEQKLQLFSDPDEPLISGYMINNYVKLHLLSAPIKKKYTREHLTSLFIICLLKKVISLNDIDYLLRQDGKMNATKEAMYQYFTTIHDEVMKYVLMQVQNILDVMKHEVDAEVKGDYELINLAMKMAIQSEVFKTMSHKILSLFETESDLAIKSAKKEKKKTKKNAKKSKKKFKKEIKKLKKQIK